jgi:hypothetical protein
VIISLIAKKNKKIIMKNIYKSWQTSLIGIFLLSLGGGYLFHNATPDYIVLYFLLRCCFTFMSDDIITQLKSFLSKNQTHYNMFLTAITDYEDLGLKSLLIATIISMGFVIIYTPQKNLL